MNGTICGVRTQREDGRDDCERKGWVEIWNEKTEKQGIGLEHVKGLLLFLLDYLICVRYLN